MAEKHNYDIIVIGAGSGGLSVGLSMAKLGFKVLVAVKSDKDIGGECLNDGCVPSKALIHVSRIVHNAKQAADFGMEVKGKTDIKKAIEYIYSTQEIIREHENAAWLREQGIEVVLGEARFSGPHEITVKSQKYFSNKIVIATGSKPRKLTVPGVELVNYFDNENVFHIKDLPGRMLVIGGGPIGIEIAQAFNRLGSNVTVIEQGKNILDHDEESLTTILLKRLRAEGIEFIFGASIEKFSSLNKAEIKEENRDARSIYFDAVFVGIGRELVLEPLQLSKAGITVKDNKS
jgi:pyruvate/2-oxoglutarate dehydrogenase complex dihydrolipoamide dehydrogenase (E3) component